MNNLFEKYYDVEFGPEDGAALSMAIRETIDWAMTHRRRQEFVAKNDALCDAVFDRLDTHLIVSTLRSTLVIRDFLECWMDKVDEAESILIKRGLNPTQILRGLKRFPK